MTQSNMTKILMRKNQEVILKSVTKRLNLCILAETIKLQTFYSYEYNFDRVQYLGTIISSYNIEQSEIQSRLSFANRSMFALNKLMSSNILSTRT